MIKNTGALLSSSVMIWFSIKIRLEYRNIILYIMKHYFVYIFTQYINKVNTGRSPGTKY